MESSKTAPAATRITATELARNLSDILNRVRYKGESFVVERQGEVIAEVRPSSNRRSITFNQLVDLWPTLPKPDDDYWKDLEEIHKLQGTMPPPPQWPV